MSIAKTRQTLLEVARELFARKGLEATTMNDIAQASQRGRRTLYTYFRNKEEIYYAVIENELERLSEKMDKVAAMDIEPEEKVLTLIYTHLQVIKERWLATAICARSSSEIYGKWSKCAKPSTEKNRTLSAAC